MTGGCGTKSVQTLVRALYTLVREHIASKMSIQIPPAPNHVSKAKEALTNVINKGQSAVNTGQNHATNLTNRVSSVANPILQTTSQVAKKLM